MSTQPDVQLFVPLTASITEHTQLPVWLQRQLYQRAVPPGALALILRYDAAHLATWERLAKALGETGVNVCAAGINSLSDSNAIVKNRLVNFAFLNSPGRDQALNDALSAQIECCRAARIKTVTHVLKSTDIASVWKSGLDCYVDQSRSV